LCTVFQTDACMIDKFDIQSVESAAAGRLIGCKVVYYKTLGSTMDEALRLAHQGFPDGTIVISDRQTEGRGRFNRVWRSNPSEDLLFSVILRPVTSQLAFLNMAASLAVLATVTSYGINKPVIKWPNDVLVGTKKISGILVEAELQPDGVANVIIGFGLNVNLDPSSHPDIAETTTSINAEIGCKVDRTRVFTNLLEHFDDLCSQIWLGHSLTQRWSNELETMGRNVRVGWKEQILEGRAVAVDDQGNLVLEHSDGTTTTVTAGEVTLRD